MMEWSFVIGANVLTGLAAVLFWSGLHNPSRISRIRLTIGVAALALACGWLVFVASNGELGGVVAFIGAIFTTGTAVISGLLLLIVFPGKHKIAAGLLLLIFPLALFASIQIGGKYSPDTIRRSDGALVVQALSRFYSDRQAYPQTLGELVPKYLVEIREPGTIWGWLYSAAEDEYTLGYVYWVDKFGYSVCVYKSNASDWSCLPNSTGPFVLGPTPMP